MAEIDKQTTEKAKKLLRVQFGINELFQSISEDSCRSVQLPVDSSPIYTHDPKTAVLAHLCLSSTNSWR